MSLTPLNERVARLEELVRAQAARVDQLTTLLARAGEGRNPRLARTTSLGMYPTRADARNCWEIVFIDSTFTETAGVQSLTSTNRRAASPWAVAHNLYNDPFVPEGTLLMVWRDNNRWWFEYEDEIQIAVLQGTLTEGGSVSVKVQLPGGGNAPGGAVTAWDKLGVMNGSSPHKAYIKWQREHAQYWIINKECDASVPSVTFTPIPDAMFIPPRREERRRLTAGGV